MPFGLGKMMLPESPGTQDPQNPLPGGGTPPGGTGFGGVTGQPDALHLRGEWRADKVKTKKGKAPGTLAVTNMINQVPTGPDLITKPGFSNPLLLTNIHGSAYAVGQVDINPPLNKSVDQPNGQISTYQADHGFQFIGNVQYQGWDISMETATPLHNLVGPAFTLYLFGSSDVYGYGWGVFGDTIQGGVAAGFNGYWHLKGVTDFEMYQVPGFAGDAFRQLNYSNPSDSSQANGFGWWFTGNNYWLDSIVCDMSKPPTGSTFNPGFGTNGFGGGEAQVQPYIDDSIIRGPLGSAASNFVYVGNVNNQGPNNALSNANFGLWVPNTNQPAITPLKAYPGDFVYFNGFPVAAQLHDPALSAWANLGDPNLSVTHVMLYQGTHTYDQRVAVRQYINNIWGHVSTNFSTADQAGIPPIY